jgi:hypothetical protein
MLGYERQVLRVIAFFERRQIHQTPADHGGQCRRLLGEAWEDQSKRLARQHYAQKATDAGDRSASEQDGSRRLGNSKARRVLHAASRVNTCAAMKV